MDTNGQTLREAQWALSRQNMSAFTRKDPVPQGREDPQVQVLNHQLTQIKSSQTKANFLLVLSSLRRVPALSQQSVLDVSSPKMMLSLCPHKIIFTHGLVCRHIVS